MSALTEWPRDAYDDDAFGGFDPAAAALSPGNARAMAWAAKLAYETSHEARMRDIATSWGFAALEPFASPNTERGRLGEPATSGFVAAGPQATVVALAGTDPLLLPNWITNLDVRMVKEDRGRLHAGFRAAAVAAQPTLRSALERMHDRDRPLVLAGHSLGGALAVLTAQWLERELHLPVRGVYSLGMPRVGDGAFAEDCGGTLGDRIFRLVHGDDIVACVPFSAAGYRHVGRYLRCPSGGRFAAADLTRDWSSNEPDFGREFVEGLLRRSLDPAAPPWPTRRTGLAGRLAAKLVEVLPIALRDHLPDRYIAACSPT